MARRDEWNEILKNEEFGDIRRNKRLIQIADMIYGQHQKGASAPLGTHARLKAASRVLRCPEVTPEKLTKNFVKQGMEKISSGHILVVQDTTELNFAWRELEIEGLGPVGNNTDQGFFLHPGIMVNPEDETVLGLAGFQLYTRKWEKERSTAYGCAKKGFEEKESYRWFSLPEQIKNNIPEGIRITIVGDRESDIYDLFYENSNGNLGTNSELLIRTGARRRVNGKKGMLCNEITAWPISCCYLQEIPSKKSRNPRIANLELRYNRITMGVPSHLLYKGKSPIENIYVVDIREKNPPKGEKGIHWTLFTTWPVTSDEEAKEKVAWYNCRWHIEELFRILKSGYKVESIKFSTAHALMNWCALRLMMAVKTLCILKFREDETRDSAKNYFNDLELKILEKMENTLISPNSQIRRPPKKTIAWAGLLVALIGGYHALPSARPFGQETLWRGLLKFQGIVEGFKLAQNVGSC
jgi:hypothetical protein